MCGVFLCITQQHKNNTNGALSWPAPSITGGDLRTACCDFGGGVVFFLSDARPVPVADLYQAVMNNKHIQ